MPLALPTKQVLLQFWWSIGGDGADVYGEYLGSLLPNVILYTDGQLLSQARSWYQETTVSNAEMCAMLQEIAATGFLQVVDPGGNDPSSPIYQFDDTAQFSDGGPEYVIQVNGSPAVQVSVYEPYERYVLPSIRAAYDLFQHYTFQPREAAPYQSQRVIVWVELGRGTEWAWRVPTYGDGPEPTPEIDSWPSDLPPLSDLLPDASGTPAYIQGPLAWEFASLPKRFGVYKDRDREYFVIVRPLLPHETVTGYGLWPAGATEFDLPLECD